MGVLLTRARTSGSPAGFWTAAQPALRVFLLIVCLPCAIGAQTPADTSAVRSVDCARDAWFGRDKADHLTVSAALTAAQYYALHRESELSSRRSLQAAALSTLVLGVAKEIYDATARRRCASAKDLAADVLGVALTILLIHK